MRVQIETLFNAEMNTITLKIQFFFIGFLNKISITFSIALTSMKLNNA